MLINQKQEHIFEEKLFYVKMNRFLKSVKSVTTNNKEDIIKKSITSHLSDSVKEIQYAGLEDTRNIKSEDMIEAANALCTTIEAIFLHGLKNTLSNRFKRAIADVDERPEPNFWSPLLIISHRQIIDQV